MKHSQKIFLISILALVLTGSGILFACNFPHAPAPIEVSVFALSGIDARFLALYQSLGGEEILGAPISPIMQDGEQWCQYTMNAKMCVLAGRTDLQAYSFAPVVVEGGLMPDSNLQQAGQESGKVVNGFVIHPDFIPLFDRLYGTRFTGQPLGNAWINYDKGRVEQYFENIVIAQDLADAERGPYLLPVAHAVCAHGCELPITTQLFIPQAQQNTSPFSAFLTRINGFDFGSPLTEPFINEEGLQVQIFEYAAVAAQPNDLSEAWLLPLAYELDMFESEPSEQRYGKDQDVYYYPVGDKGYHVLVWFDAFIMQHGGRNVAGNPIAEIAYYGEDIRQCFENYCLDLVQDPQSGQPTAELAPLGAWYLGQLLESGAISESLLLKDYVSADQIQFEIGEQFPSIDHETSQVIYLSIISAETGQPLSGIPGRVTLLTPDNQRIDAGLMKTNAQGVTWVNLPAHSDLENGTVIRYEVCFDLVSGEEVCEVNAYLVKD